MRIVHLLLFPYLIIFFALFLINYYRVNENVTSTDRTSTVTSANQVSRIFKFIM